MVLDQWIDLTNWAARWVCFDLSVVTLKSFVCSEHLHSWRFCLNLYHWLILISIARWTARCYFLKVKLIFHIMSIVKHLKWWVGRIWFTGVPHLSSFLAANPTTAIFGLFTWTWEIFALIGDPLSVPLTRIMCNTVFSKSQILRMAGILCTVDFFNATSWNPNEYVCIQ